MIRRLDTITDWAAQAKKAHYRVGELARSFDVSTRSLEYYFKANRNISPHAFFAQLRILEIQKRAKSGEPGKTLREQVGFAHFSSFSRALHRDFARSLRQIRKTDR